MNKFGVEMRWAARFLGLKSPIAYEWMKLGGKKVKKGVNFAYGGSGVFNTLGDLLPNMSTQIGFFQTLLHDSLFTPWDLKSSVVLVSLAGNDYGAFLAQGGTMQVPNLNSLSLSLSLPSLFKIDEDISFSDCVEVEIPFIVQSIIKK